MEKDYIKEVEDIKESYFYDEKKLLRELLIEKTFLENSIKRSEYTLEKKKQALLEAKETICELRGHDFRSWYYDNDSYKHIGAVNGFVRTCKCCGYNEYQKQMVKKLK